MIDRTELRNEHGDGHRLPVFVRTDSRRHRLMLWAGRGLAAVAVIYSAALVASVLGVDWVPATHLPLPSAVLPPALDQPHLSDVAVGFTPPTTAAAKESAATSTDTGGSTRGSGSVTGNGSKDPAATTTTSGPASGTTVAGATTTSAPSGGPTTAPGTTTAHTNNGQGSGPPTSVTHPTHP